MPFGEPEPKAGAGVVVDPLGAAREPLAEGFVAPVEDQPSAVAEALQAVDALGAPSARTRSDLHFVEQRGRWLRTGDERA